jgi:hypothetical protein
MENEHNRYERRNFPVEMRVKTDEKTGEYIEGHSAVFNTWAEIYPNFFERIMPGAFVDTITEDDIRCLFNHDMNYPLGRVSAGNLELQEDETGLGMRCKPTDTTYSRDLKVNIAANVVKEQSFSFFIKDRKKDQIWESRIENGIEKLYRTILRCRVMDVSPVTYPAYEDTDVSVRCIDEYRNSEEYKKIIEEHNATETRIEPQPPADTGASESASGGETPGEDMSEIETDLRIRETKLRNAVK